MSHLSKLKLASATAPVIPLDMLIRRTAVFVAVCSVVWRCSCWNPAPAPGCCAALLGPGYAGSLFSDSAGRGGADARPGRSETRRKWSTTWDAETPNRDCRSHKVFGARRGSGNPARYLRGDAGAGSVIGLSDQVRIVHGDAAQDGSDSGGRGHPVPPDQFQRAFAPGAGERAQTRRAVVSHDFEIRGWQAEQTEKMMVQGRPHMIYAYRMGPTTRAPARKLRRNNPRRSRGRGFKDLYGLWRAIGNGAAFRPMRILVHPRQVFQFHATHRRVRAAQRHVLAGVHRHVVVGFLQGWETTHGEKTIEPGA